MPLVNNKSCSLFAIREEGTSPDRRRNSRTKLRIRNRQANSVSLPGDHQSMRAHAFAIVLAKRLIVSRDPQLIRFGQDEDREGIYSALESYAVG